MPPPPRAFRASAARGATVETDVPARLDRLPWGRFHWLVVVALGITWILDGLEVTLAGAVGGTLRQSPTLQFSAADVGLANSAYVTGAVAGALLFGWLTDRLGRKRLFSITLLLYLLAAAGTAFTWNLPGFALMRFLTGAGIGGEYSAINSAIQELIPPRFRGRTDISINGSFWVGAAIAGAGSLVLLDPHRIDPELGWRLAFFIGAAIGVPILPLRRFIPESPRWLMLHGRAGEAEAVVEEIEARFTQAGHALVPARTRVRLHDRAFTPFADVIDALLRLYPRRTVLCLGLMISQAFFYNAIFFTYALLLTDFYGVKASDVGWYVLPFAVGNVLGPLLLGPLFDTIGRRPMIAFTYAASAALLLVTGLLFRAGALTATTQTMGWSATFFFASAAASAANLTVGENFPLEVRALAIAVFYALGTGLGGIAAPWLFGVLIESGSRDRVLLGYLLACVLMALAAALVLWLGERAERRPLEEVAAPLSSADP
ncbi:MFS transporter [Limobrevibacterium gyesilva]|uniref:MFS transporter n=1 Tax=Limobrevibacterium gyesilva TaxID=2991712 RepID=A0AA41YQC1_9PROT|nr:MFS transporter [Limobrevibacterium gyesilva]MCW3476338.1 MFS transporter [Limobrevibacterium gyesilva]